MLTFISLREMLTFIYLREMPTFISLRSIKLASQEKTLGPRKNSGPDTDSTQQKTRAELRGPRFHRGENSGPNTRGQIPPRRKLGPRYSGPDSTQGNDTRAQISPGAKFGPGYSGPDSLGTDLPCPRPSSCPCAPISPSLRHHLAHHVTAWAPSWGRYWLGLTSIASCCRSWRES